MRMIPEIALGPGAEFDLIRRFLRRTEGAAGGSARHPVHPALAERVAVGPGDDCAIITGERIALSVDMAVEDVHFRRAWIEPQEIGYRAASAALSDLAACAALPVGIMVGIALARADAEEFAPRVMEGVHAAAGDAGAVLLGGDVSRSPGPFMLDIVVVGDVERAVLRSGAAPGDTLWVTGRLGGAAAAVRAWREGGQPTPEARLAFVRPAPKWREARWLAERGLARALIDLSDGLAGDAGHMAAASGVRLLLDASAIPIHDAAGAEATDRALAFALHGGEDYELLIAAPAIGMEGVVAEFAQRFNTPLTRVGEVTQGAGVFLSDAESGERALEGGFDHLASPWP